MQNLHGESDTPSTLPHSSGFPDQDVCCVVGSGPAGVACAQALLAAGRRVLMLDSGLTLEPERQALVQQFKTSRPELWSADQLTAYKAGMEGGKDGVPVKLVYGSDYPYREAEQNLGVQFGNVGVRPSLARGGLSNVWGAAMLPFQQRDIDDWPIKSAALAEDYAAVLSLTGLAGTHDDLEKDFPLHTNKPTELKLSRQAAQALSKLERNREKLVEAGIRFGRSRLAVRGNAPGSDAGCVYCRLCMYGCPYGHIYTASDTISELQKNPRFTYRPGVVVTTVREAGEAVQVSGFERGSRRPMSWEYSRVFLAAGTIATTGILLRSLDAYGETVFLKDSQYFLAPMLLLRSAPGAMLEPLHALCQLFVEFAERENEPQAHLQIYSNNDLINEAVAKSFGPLRKPMKPLVRMLQERMLLAQGFLHSKDSSQIAVCLKKYGTEERLELEPRIDPRAAQLARKVVNKMYRHAFKFGALPLLPMVKITEPGRSFHNGGSFPMAQSPRGFQTDTLGRVPGWERIHAVDATVLPSIPPTTITLTVMANAHRIGRLAAELKPLPQRP